MCSFDELDAEEKDKEKELRKINYSSESFFVFLLFFFFFLAFIKKNFFHLFVVLPSWFGEFLHRRSLLQVSLRCC